MFVHDFVAVPVPVDETVRRFTAELPTPNLAALIKQAWNADAPILVAAGAGPLNLVQTHRVHVELADHRLRNDAAIVGLRWSGDGWLPKLDADLELVGFGHATTHLHLMGRYELPESIDRFSPTGSLVQRVVVVAVRTFLVNLSDALERLSA